MWKSPMSVNLRPSNDVIGSFVYLTYHCAKNEQKCNILMMMLYWNSYFGTSLAAFAMPHTRLQRHAAYCSFCQSKGWCLPPPFLVTHTFTFQVELESQNIPSPFKFSCFSDLTFSPRKPQCQHDRGNAQSLDDRGKTPEPTWPGKTPKSTRQRDAQLSSFQIFIGRKQLVARERSTRLGGRNPQWCRRGKEQRSCDG